MSLWWEPCPKCDEEMIVDTSRSGVSNCPYCMYFPDEEEVKRLERLHKIKWAQTPTTGINAIIGKWPGNETDQEIREGLDKL